MNTPCPQSSKSRGLVLVVDDEPLILRIVRHRLEQAGYDVVTRTEALGTLNEISRLKPQLVLMDVNMPALSGLKLARLIRNDRRFADVGLVLHSSEDLGVLRGCADTVGALGAIPKTNDGELFITLFESLFERCLVA
jgi:CheY-like chemotaxis protein